VINFTVIDTISFLDVILSHVEDIVCTVCLRTEVQKQRRQNYVIQYKQLPNNSKVIFKGLFDLGIWIQIHRRDVPIL